MVNKRASILDDFYSLFCVTYHLIHDDLPWSALIDELMEKDSNLELYDTKNFIGIRTKLQE